MKKDKSVQQVDQKSNFTQTLSTPESVIVILPQELDAFLASLWCIKIIQETFPESTFLIKQEQWFFFPKLIYPETAFTFLPYKHLDNYLQKHNNSLVMLLCTKIDKALLKKLQSPSIILAGMSNFFSPDVLKLIIEVKNEYSFAQNFFNFACQICQKKMNFMEYVQEHSYKQSKGLAEKIIAIDITKGLNGSRFQKKHIISMIDFFTSNGYDNIFLLDIDDTYFCKLEKKISQNIQSLITDDWQVLYDTFKNIYFIITHNSMFGHLTQLSTLPSYVFLMPYEHKHFFGTVSKNRIFISSFGALSLKHLHTQLERML